MKLFIQRKQCNIRKIALLSSLILLISIFFPSAFASETITVDELNYGIQPASISNICIAKNESNQIVISAVIANTPFAVEGTLYNVYDNIDNNIIYFIEDAPDYTLPVVILNIEFEINAQKENLNPTNLSLVGEDVIRVAAYVNETFYYAEQHCEISSIITDNTIPISRTVNDSRMDAIISNSSWFTHICRQELKSNSDSDSGSSYSIMATSSSLPSLDASLDTTDIDVIGKIGRDKFTKEQFIYGSTSTGGYLIQCVEWPSGSGNILTSCLYYEIVRTVPNTSKTTATLEVELVADRQYLWISDSNTIKADFLGTDFRMYDVNLALACTQTNSKGYDYVWKKTVSLYQKNTENKLVNATVGVAKVIALQFDKYGILAATDAIAEAFADGEELSGTTICSWPYEYDDHYASISHGKKAGKMMRGLEFCTEGHLLTQEKEYLFLEGHIVDRDYESSATNVSMTKSIDFLFSYNLRSKNGFWGWLFKGDNHGEITYESSKSYTK